MKKLLIVLFAGLGLLAGCSSGKPAIAVSASSSASTVQAGGTAQITATLSNDSSGKGVTWTVTCSAAPCGSVSPASSTTSPYATTYTAPSAAPSSNLTVTITATSASDSTKSGSVTVTVPAIAVSLNPSTPQTVDSGSSKQFTATVANDPASGGVTWTVSCSTAPCGSVAPTSTASGTATTYTAPATPPANDLAVTLTATSATDSTKSASVTITVPAVTVSVSPATQTIEAGSAGQQFTATVGGTSNTSVSWVLYNGAVPCSPTCGTLNSGTSNPVTYTAPSTPPSSDLIVTLTATSSADATKSGSATITVPALSVSVSPKTATVEATQTTQITATVANFSGNTGVNWVVSCGVVQCGSVSPTSTASGTATTYTAPSTPPSADLTVTVTAKSKDDATKSASATITVPAISVSVAPTAPSVTISTTQNFTATVTNDPSATPSVNWNLSGSGCSGATCGTLSATSSASGTAITYTAPATVPSPATVTLTATSVTDTSKTASATITITAVTCGTGSESLLNGHYAFLLKGFDNGSPAEPVLVGGVITADGTGKITAGTVDMNVSGGTSADYGMAVTTASSSYSIGSDHRGCMTLTTSAGTQDYRFSLGGISSGVASTGHMIDFDTTGPFTTGVLLQQTTSAFSVASVTGNYAFGFSSIQNTLVTNDNNVAGGKFAVVGVSNLAAGAITGGELDVNQNGELDANTANTAWPSSPISINAGGTYTIDATSGRGTLTFTPSVASGPATDVIYVVSSNEFLLLNSDDQTSNVIFAGTALKQSGSFSNSTLSGNYVGYESGLGSSSGTTRAGLFLVNFSNGSISGTSWENKEGTFSSGAISGTYSVDSKGRMTVGGTGSQPPIFYVADSNEFFILESNGAVSSGLFQAQTGSSFTASSVNGTFAFGTFNPQDPSVSDSSGSAVFDGNGNLTGKSDSNSNGSQNFDGAISQTYSVTSSGLVQSPSGCTLTSSSTTCSPLFFIVSPTRLIFIDDPTKPNPSIGTADK